MSSAAVVIDALRANGPNKQMTIQNVFHPSYILLRFNTYLVDSVELDEVAHYKPPNLELCCLKIQLLSFLLP